MSSLLTLDESLVEGRFYGRRFCELNKMTKKEIRERQLVIKRHIRLSRARISMAYIELECARNLLQQVNIPTGLLESMEYQLTEYENSLKNSQEELGI